MGSVIGVIYVTMIESEGEEIHRYLLLNQTKFSGNIVKRSDPLITVTNLNDLQICCELSSKCLIGEDLHEIDNSCVSGRWESQHMLGTFVETVMVFPDKISNYASGDVLPDISVTFLDAFRNAAPVKATLTVRLLNYSDDVDLLVPPAANMMFNGTLNVTGIKLTAQPGEYRFNLEFVTSEGNIKILNKSISVHVQECGIGEYSAYNHKRCLPCSINLYNFNPSEQQCELCKPKARCNGTTLAPVDGYWHNSSHSDVLLRCVNDEACTYNGRISSLMESAQMNIAAGTTWDKGYPLCKKVRLTMAGF